MSLRQAAPRFRVAAIFYSGMYEYDATFAYVAFEEAGRLLSYELKTGRPALGTIPVETEATGGAGVVVSDTTSETRIATDNVTANSRNSRPIMPPMKRIGMKTAMSERVIDTMVKPTSRDPSTAAR